MPLLSRGVLLLLTGGVIIFSMLLYATHPPHYVNGADVGRGTAVAFFTAGLAACGFAIPVQPETGRSRSAQGWPSTTLLPWLKFR